jgi:hypothetical protein
MTTPNTQNISSESPLRQGMSRVLQTYPLPLPQDENDISLADTFGWVMDIKNDPNHAPLLGFDSSLKYGSDHINTLAQIAQQI